MNEIAKNILKHVSTSSNDEFKVIKLSDDSIIIESNGNHMEIDTSSDKKESEYQQAGIELKDSKYITKIDSSKGLYRITAEGYKAAEKL